MPYVLFICLRIYRIHFREYPHWANQDYLAFQEPAFILSIKKPLRYYEIVIGVILIITKISLSAFVNLISLI